jgi:putative flippase GtrA
MKKLINKKRDLFFIMAGILAVISDFLCYIFLVKYLSILTAKGISFFFGVIVSWVINSKLTFKYEKKNPKVFFKYLLVVVISVLLNIYSNEFYLAHQTSEHKFFLSFIFATAISTTNNFIWFKLWVFRK